VELIWVIAAGIYVAGAAGLAWWLLEPMNRVAGQLQFSTRFVLTDFLGLMIMIQGPLAVVGRAMDSTRGPDSAPYWLLLSITLFLVLILWAAAVSVVSRAGITRIWQRLCVIVLLVPGTLTIIIVWPLCLIFFIGFIASRMMLAEWDFDWGPGLFALPALVAAALAIRWMSYWAIKGSPGEAVLKAILSGRKRGTPITMPASHLPPGTNS